jgi:hypothetical protein
MSKSKRRNNMGAGQSPLFQDAFEACFDPVAAAKLRAHAERDRELQSRHMLKELLGQLTPENCHPEVDWGTAVGKEILDDDQP